MERRERIDRTVVPAGALDRMAESDTRPSPGLEAAIERARQRSSANPDVRSTTEHGNNPNTENQPE